MIYEFFYVKISPTIIVSQLKKLNVRKFDMFFKLR